MSLQEGILVLFYSSGWKGVKVWNELTVLLWVLYLPPGCSSGRCTAISSSSLEPH